MSERKTNKQTNKQIKKERRYLTALPNVVDELIQFRWANGLWNANYIVYLV